MFYKWSFTPLLLHFNRHNTAEYWGEVQSRRHWRHHAVLFLCCQPWPLPCGLCSLHLVHVHVMIFYWNVYLFTILPSVWVQVDFYVQCPLLAILTAVHVFASAVIYIQHFINMYCYENDWSGSWIFNPYKGWVRAQSEVRKTANRGVKK